MADRRLASEEDENTSDKEPEVFRLDSSAFLSFVFFCKILKTQLQCLIFAFYCFSVTAGHAEQQMLCQCACKE